MQAYEGVCIGRAGGGVNENFTVRKISYGEGVERVFPVHSPLIEFDRGGAPRPGAPRQALLSARPARQGGPHPRAPGGQAGKKAEAFKGFTKPKGEPDDLKLIPGVTPELEKKLNKLGLIKFEQIANLTDDEIARLDEAAQAQRRHRERRLGRQIGRADGRDHGRRGPRRGRGRRPKAEARPRPRRSPQRRPRPKRPSPPKSPRRARSSPDMAVMPASWPGCPGHPRFLLLGGGRWIARSSRAMTRSEVCKPAARDAI